MARANSVLAILLITVHSTMAFPSTIHEKMTKAERLAVFGSEYSVPEYRVFPMSLPGARRRRETDVGIKLTVELENKTIDLDLKPTAGYLASKYTPVWFAKSDEHAYQNIRYEPLPKAMSKIGDFKMYHDVANGAAVTTYTDFAEGTVIEGIVTLNYGIRSLPKRLMSETLKVGPHMIDHSAGMKRSVTSDSEEDTGHYAIFKISDSPNHVEPSAFVDLNNREGNKRDKRAIEEGRERKLPKALYPEILLVLDYNAIRDHTTTQALRYMLALWNGADLIYREFDKPKVRLNIAGIIIAADDRATPYIASDTSENSLHDDSGILSRIGEYFYKEKVRFPMNGYDMIIVMTPIGSCPVTPTECFFIVYGSRNFACSLEHEVSRESYTDKTALIGYNWQFSGTGGAVEACAKFFGGTFLLAKYFRKCPNTDDHIMTRNNPSVHRDFKWSQCNRRFMSAFFSSNKSMCLDNKPLWRKTVGKVLPGRWMSMDGQCRNEGFVKACSLKKKWTCKANGCQNPDSVDCIRTSGVPLPGSKCGSDKHCSTKKKCIRN